MQRQIPNLTVVIIVTAPRPHFLRLAGVPHIHFQPYNRTESLTIVSQDPLPVYDGSLTMDVDTQPNHSTDEGNTPLWKRFCGAVWDSLGKAAARDIVSLRRLCERMWPQFTAPIKEEGYNTKSFSQLMVRNRALFQNSAILVETHLQPSLTSGAKKRLTKGKFHALCLLSPL